MSIQRIILDPGHGGINPSGEYVTAGKRYVFDDGTTIYEGERMRVLAVALGARLIERGFDVVSSLTGAEMLGPSWSPTYTDVPLSMRVQIANAFDPSRTLFVSLHSNAISNSSEGIGQTKARGISVYTSEGTTASDRYATKVWEALRDADVLPMRSQSYADGDPDYEAGFYVLRKTKCPAMLLELGFHDHPVDAAELLEQSTIDALADALADGLQRAV